MHRDREGYRRRGYDEENQGTAEDAEDPRWTPRIGLIVTSLIVTSAPSAHPLRAPRSSLRNDVRALDQTSMRLLFAIPHFFAGVDPNATNRSQRPAARQERVTALVATISALQRTFGDGIYGLDHFRHAAWQAAPPDATRLDIAVCTAGDRHLLDDVPMLRPCFRHHAAAADPAMLGFECHRVLAAARGRYDYYAYLEDDIVLDDPLFFRKRCLFDERFGPEALLQPNRFEAQTGSAVQKLYVDYRLTPARTARYQDLADRARLEMPFLGETIAFERTPYPSSGAFFLSEAQLARWVAAPAFRDGDVSYLSPLDSAATLSVMKTFRIYKPVLDQAWFLKVEHASPRWIAWATRQTRLEPRASAPP
jgi:hypothetical protein